MFSIATPLFENVSLLSRINYKVLRNITTSSFCAKKPREIIEPFEVYNEGVERDLPENIYEGGSHRLSQRVYAWGAGSCGALGRSKVRPKGNKKANMEGPIRVHIPDQKLCKITDVSCGYGFTAYVINDKNLDSLYGTGINTYGQIGQHYTAEGNFYEGIYEPRPIKVPLEAGDRIVKVSCGRGHTVALSRRGVAYSCGHNSLGQCGREIMEGEDYRATRPQRIEGFEQPVKDVVCGHDTSFFLLADGSVWSCGWSADGQTGRGTYETQPRVGPVSGELAGEKVLKLRCGADTVLALTEGGSVFGWGNNEHRQFGAHATQLPSPRGLALPPAIGGVRDVGASGSACFLLNERGEVYSWGYGILGRGPEELISHTPCLIPPTLVGATAFNPDDKVVSLACGAHNAGAVTASGNLFTWGRNTNACLGQRHRRHSQSFPLQVFLLGKVLKLSCGADHMAALVREL